MRTLTYLYQQHHHLQRQVALTLSSIMAHDSHSSMKRRTRTGCIGCRLRRKKCTEEKPSCTGCLRNEILCIWPQTGDQKHAELLRRTYSWPYSQDHAGPGRDVRVLQSNARALDSTLTTYCPDVSWSPTLQSTQSRRLLHHFVSCTSKCLALGLDGEGVFLAEMIPLAMNSEVVLNSILACSGTHLSELSSTRIDSDTWTYYGQALQAQKFTMTRLARGDDKCLGAALVTAVVLCIMEVR